MVTITGVETGYGAVTFYKEIDPVPASSHRDGNVTVNNMGSPGRPSYFEASFMLDAGMESGGLSFHNIFHLKALVTGQPKDTPYAQVETEAYEQLAPMLRALAQALEDQAKALSEASNSEAS